jgi:hypothetical protein
MKLVLQQDLMRNVTKDKIGELKLLIEEYQHSHVFRPDVSSDLQSALFSMSNLLNVQLDVLNDIKLNLAERTGKGEKIKENKDEK